jgi:hypothetical protein
MNGFNSKWTGQLMLIVGVTGVIAVVSLLLFFFGLYQDIPSLSFMGAFNDTVNAMASILGATLASFLHPTLQKHAPRLSFLMLISAWAGAIAVTYGSWLIVTGSGDVQLSSYYFFFGNGLLGIWLWLLNYSAHQKAVWPHNFTRLGMIASGLMMVGFLGLYGILSGSDGDDYSPLIMTTGVSFLGIGFFYPAWCVRLGSWILSEHRNIAARQR